MAEFDSTTQTVVRWAYSSLATARAYTKEHGHPMHLAVVMRTITDRDRLREKFNENWEHPKAATFHFLAPNDTIPVAIRIHRVATMGKFNPGSSWILGLIARCVRGAGIRTWTDLTDWEPTVKEMEDAVEARIQDVADDLPPEPEERESFPHIAIEREPDSEPASVNEVVGGDSADMAREMAASMSGSPPEPDTLPDNEIPDADPPSPDAVDE